VIPVVAAAAATAAATSSSPSSAVAAPAASGASPAPTAAPFVAAYKGWDGGVTRRGSPAALALAESEQVDGDVERARAVKGVRGRQVEPELQQGQGRGQGRLAAMESLTLPA